MIEKKNLVITDEFLTELFYDFRYHKIESTVRMTFEEYVGIAIYGIVDHFKYYTGFNIGRKNENHQKK